MEGLGPAGWTRLEAKVAMVHLCIFWGDECSTASGEILGREGRGGAVRAAATGLLFRAIRVEREMVLRIALLQDMMGKILSFLPPDNCGMDEQDLYIWFNERGGGDLACFDTKRVMYEI